MSWIIAILQLYSQVADLFRNVIVKRINIRLFDLLARFNYILNLPRISKLHSEDHDLGIIFFVRKPLKYLPASRNFIPKLLIITGYIYVY